MNLQSKYDRQRGLYRREYEHDACGVGMVANLSGEASHEIVTNGLTVLKRLMHRGATGNDPETGDGAGLLLKIPHAFFLGKVAFLRDRLGESASKPFGIAREKRRKSSLPSRAKVAKWSPGATSRPIRAPSGTTPAP